MGSSASPGVYAVLSDYKEETTGDEEKFPALE
jgi:hypothetical protein